MRKILIDTDPGIDDAMAIHLAFAHPELEVVGLTTVFGNVHVDKATRNALALVEMAAAGCPVAEGAAEPLEQPLNPPAYFVHGPEGFGDLPAMAPVIEPDRRNAAQFIVDTINAHPGEIALCPVGPLTNIAMALRLDPGIVDKVYRVVIMGGAVATDGNVTPWAEANIWNDPHAAAEVFAANWPMMLVGLDVTEQTQCSPADFAFLATQAPIIGGFLNKAVPFYFNWHRQKEVLDGCFLHDPSAIMAVVDAGLFSCEQVPIRVVTEGHEIGRTVPDPECGNRPVAVCQGVHAARLKTLFLALLGAADACRAQRLR